MQKKLTPLRSVRAYCLWCSDTSPEVSQCPSESCALWPYRHGHNPKLATKGMTATYSIDEKMTATKAIGIRCRDCHQTRGDCKCPECPLYHIRQKARISRRGATSCA